MLASTSTPRRAYIPFLLAVKTIYPQRACKGTAFFRHKQKKVQYFIKYCTLVPIFQKSLNSVESFSSALPLSHILFTPSFTHSLHSSTPHSTNSLFHLSNNSHSYAYHVPFHMFFPQKEHAMRWVGTCYEVGRNILYCQLIIQVQTFFRKTIGLIWLLRNIRICQTYQITTHCRLKVIIYKVPTTILLQT